ncbi:type II secretion system protein N [Aquidulcibacter paucihalophilus]|nr:type II secretion system protein N [Aquidulcibacter paucihalophilus]
MATRPDRMRQSVEVVLALALTAQLAQLGWIALGPAAAAGAATNPTPAPFQPADPTVFQRFDAFFRTGGQSSLAEASAAGNGQMRLYGLRSDGAGGGSAIIGLADGRQVSVGVGEEVEPGLVLRGVGADHVTLARGGSVSRLVFTDLPMGVAPVPPPPPGPQTVTPAPAVSGAPAGASIDPARLLGQAGLRPRMRGARLDGFTVSGAGDAAVLRAAGLQAGDVILAVNGQPLDSLERIAALRSQLANSAGAELRIERDGQVQTSTLGSGQ